MTHSTYKLGQWVLIQHCIKNSLMCFQTPPARQVLYHWATFQILFYFILFFIYYYFYLINLFGSTGF
jgi:hypothetical protein